MEVKSYRDLLVWQKGVDLAVECYKLTESFPKSELYGLTNQMRRAAVSIPSNVAEGSARQHTPEFTQHVSIACGSIAELDTQVEIARRLHFADEQLVRDFFAHTEELSRMLGSLRRSLQTKQERGK
ncbi:MAG: four helix bundle protein [Armatimonadota bacterium]